MFFNQKLALFFYSHQNLFGILFALSEWLAFQNVNAMIILYAVGFAIGEMWALHADSFVYDIRLNADKFQWNGCIIDLIERCEPRLPNEAMRKLYAIQEIVLHISNRLTDKSPIFVHFTLGQILTQRLQKTLKNYFQLPFLFTILYPLSNQKTSYQNLINQLDILLTELSKISENLHRQDERALIANTSILNEKFRIETFIDINFFIQQIN